MIYHLQGSMTYHPICRADVPESLTVPNWRSVPAGKHRACLRCVRKLHHLRITEKVPVWLIPKVGKATITTDTPKEP